MSRARYMVDSTGRRKQYRDTKTAAFTLAKSNVRKGSRVACVSRIVGHRNTRVHCFHARKRKTR